jgi:hypothetical protein
MHITTNGSAQFLDSSYACGCAWDTCFGPLEAGTPDTPVTPYIPIEITCAAKLFPSVTQGDLILEYEQFFNGTFRLYSILGQLLSEAEVVGLEGREIFRKETLANGIYLWEMRSGGKVCGKGKVILAN